MRKLPRQSVRLQHLLLAFLGLLAISSAQPARGQGAEGHNGQYRYRAVFVETPPTVDGDLSDTVWQVAEVIDRLIQQEPDAGAPSSENTEVRIIYDSTALYIAAYCHDSDPSGIVRNIRNRSEYPPFPGRSRVDERRRHPFCF